MRESEVQIGNSGSKVHDKIGELEIKIPVFRV
jgi:hypothetical protein